MTGQVRLVTSWMISAGPDARAGARPALTLTLTLALAPLGSAPQAPIRPGCFPPYPSPYSSLLYSLFTPRRISTRTSLARRITRARIRSSDSSLPLSLCLSRSPRPRHLRAKPPAKTMLLLFMRVVVAGKMSKIDGEKRKEKRPTACTSPRCMHTKLCRGESNLPAVASIGDFRADGAPGASL